MIEARKKERLGTMMINRTKNKKIFSVILKTVH